MKPIVDRFTPGTYLAMNRFLFAVAALVLLSPDSVADETLIRLRVQPMPAPEPALRYMLLPELKEMSPGNPIQNYLKCALDEYRFVFDKGQFERRETLLAMPLAEVELEELHDFGKSALAQVDRAARLDNPDWQILLKIKADGIKTLLPDLLQIRGLTRALQQRFRSEVAISRFDEAIRTAKTMFAMSRHLDAHPTLIGNLVGIETANLAIAALDEMLAQPGCPNLYWALTNLPAPLVTFESGRAGERLMVSTVFDGLNSEAPMSAAELKKFIDSLDVLLGDGDAAKANARVRAWIDERARDQARIAAASARLIKSGIPEKAVRSFSTDQLILLDEKRECDVRFDDVTKILGFPAWQVELLAENAKPSKEPALFADALVSEEYAVRRSQGRLEQRIALVIHVEALRMYAAEHNGAFPSRLADISVPLPADPFRGKAFRYEATGKTAHVRGTPPESERKNVGYSVHYEITVRE
jgi:hypothetical protein